MDDLDIRHIASGAQGDVYAFTVSHPAAPSAALSEGDELIRLLESVDIRRETAGSHQSMRSQGHGHAAFDLPVEEAGRAEVAADAERQSSRQGHGARCARVRAVKVVSAGPDGVMPRLRPHNAKVEMQVLIRLQHPNVIKLLAYRYDPVRCEHLLVVPFYPCTLRQWLDTHPILAEVDSLLQEPNGVGEQRGSASPEAVEYFRDRSDRLTRQLLDVLVYLHSQGVAHRDLKPENIMLDDTESLVLVDFATAWTFGDAEFGAGLVDVGLDGITGGDADALAVGMCEVEVGTGSYRAPELLFGPAPYDATKIDIWAAGCIICEIFRLRPDPAPLQASNNVPDIADDAAPDDTSITSSSASSNGDDEDSSEKVEGPLFSSTFGDIGLAGSIFGLLGTPTADSWLLLPDANKIPFYPRPPRDIGPCLPRLQVLPEADAARFMGVVGRMMRLDPAGRCSAAEARKLFT